VGYEPYEGATLTDAGRDRAANLHESYVTLSWFFRSVLELKTHESEAMNLAGAIDPSVADQLTTVLPAEKLQGETVCKSTLYDIYGLNRKHISNPSSEIVDGEFRRIGA
jgi:Mn-dependent DtxR family transcriptional regulator